MLAKLLVYIIEILLFLITWANIGLLRLWDTNEGERENFNFFTQLICFYIDFILNGLMWINLYQSNRSMWIIALAHR